MKGQQLNPYAAPRSVEPQVCGARSDSLACLGIPSAALLVLPTLWEIAWLHAILVHAVYGDASHGPLRIAAGVQADLVLLLVFLTASAFVACGAVMMRRGQCYRVSVAAAIIACIPVLSPWIYFGIPFGIWAVIVLRRPSVRAAFADVTASENDQSK